MHQFCSCAHIQTLSKHKFDSGLFFFWVKLMFDVLWTPHKNKKLRVISNMFILVLNLLCIMLLPVLAKRKPLSSPLSPAIQKTTFATISTFVVPSLTSSTYIRDRIIYVDDKPVGKIDVLCEMKTIKMSLRKRKSKAHPLVVAVACNDGGSHYKNARTRWR